MDEDEINEGKIKKIIETNNTLRSIKTLLKEIKKEIIGITDFRNYLPKLWAEFYPVDQQIIQKNITNYNLKKNEENIEQILNIIFCYHLKVAKLNIDISYLTKEGECIEHDSEDKKHTRKSGKNINIYNFLFPIPLLVNRPPPIVNVGRITEITDKTLDYKKITSDCGCGEFHIHADKYYIPDLYSQEGGSKKGGSNESIESGNDSISIHNEKKNKNINLGTFLTAIVAIAVKKFIASKTELPKKCDFPTLNCGKNNIYSDNFVYLAHGACDRDWQMLKRDHKYNEIETHVHNPLTFKLPDNFDVITFTRLGSYLTSSILNDRRILSYLTRVLYYDKTFGNIGTSVLKDIAQCGQFYSGDIDNDEIDELIVKMKDMNLGDQTEEIQDKKFQKESLNFIPSFSMSGSIDDNTQSTIEQIQATVHGKNITIPTSGAGNVEQLFPQLHGNTYLSTICVHRTPVDWKGQEPSFISILQDKKNEPMLKTIANNVEGFTEEINIENWDNVKTLKQRVFKCCKNMELYCQYRVGKYTDELDTETVKGKGKIKSINGKEYLKLLQSSKEATHIIFEPETWMKSGFEEELIIDGINDGINDIDGLIDYNVNNEKGFLIPIALLNYKSKYDILKDFMIKKYKYKITEPNVSEETKRESLGLGYEALYSLVTPEPIYLENMIQKLNNECDNPESRKLLIIMCCAPLIDNCESESSFVVGNQDIIHDNWYNKLPFKSLTKYEEAASIRFRKIFTPGVMYPACQSETLETPGIVHFEIVDKAVGTFGGKKRKSRRYKSRRYKSRRYKSRKTKKKSKRQKTKKKSKRKKTKRKKSKYKR